MALIMAPVRLDHWSRNERRSVRCWKKLRCPSFYKNRFHCGTGYGGTYNYIDSELIENVTYYRSNCMKMLPNLPTAKSFHWIHHLSSPTSNRLQIIWWQSLLQPGNTHRPAGFHNAVRWLRQSNKTRRDSIVQRIGPSANQWFIYRAGAPTAPHRLRRPVHQQTAH